MALVVDQLIGTTDKVPSNESSPTLYEAELSDNSVESLPISSRASSYEVLPNNVSDPGIFNDEDISGTLISSNILEIIFDYALNKFDDCRDRLEVGRPKFISVLNRFVKVGDRIDMCLPAFPFKSANKVNKALGFLPDKAEEIALARLNDMCRRIEEIYAPGARVVIVSDGLVYNDLLSISDRDTWRYGQALRAMSEEIGFTNIEFSRLRDFVDFKLPEPLDEIHYVANATNFRRFILNKFGKDDLDVDHLIAVDEDTRLTYQGYRRFLMSDLRHIFTLGADRSHRAYKRETKYLAKQMLVRGYAFAGVVKANFPHHLRLSIHQSTGEHKVSMSLLNTKTGFTTPWHCSVALMADGEWVSAPMGDFKDNPRMKVVEERGRPSYFRETTEEEYREEQRLAELSVQVSEKAVVVEREKETSERRNENFLHWADVAYDSVDVGSGSGESLSGVDGWLRGGTTTALMGVSGSGTTTLLDVLANHPASGIVHGEILMNGQPRSAASQYLVGVVHQHDLHFAGVTVKEALILSALLRQPKTKPYTEKIASAEDVITLVGLEAVADTVIGTDSRNLNCEQRKRLAIGVELAAKPITLLLLDQPLAGLDSQAALSVCALLRKLAHTGLAVLCTVNQPSARVLQNFDRLLLLAKGGKQLYFGKTGLACKTVTSYFERNGAPSCNAYESPAEWILELTDSKVQQDWSEIWNNSPERKAMKMKLLHLKEMPWEPLESIDDVSTSDTVQRSVAGFDAMALERTFRKYLSFGNTELPTDSSKSGICKWCLTSHASVHRPVCFQ